MQNNYAVPQYAPRGGYALSVMQRPSPFVANPAQSALLLDPLQLQNAAVNLGMKVVREKAYNEPKAEQYEVKHDLGNSPETAVSLMNYNELCENYRQMIAQGTRYANGMQKNRTAYTGKYPGTGYGMSMGAVKGGYAGASACAAGCK